MKNFASTAVALILGAASLAAHAYNPPPPEHAAPSYDETRTTQNNDPTPPLHAAPSYEESRTIQNNDPTPGGL